MINENTVRAIATPVIWPAVVGALGFAVLYVQPMMARGRTAEHHEYQNKDRTDRL